MKATERDQMYQLLETEFKRRNLERRLIKAVRSKRKCPHCGSTTHPPGCCAQDGHGG